MHKDVGTSEPFFFPFFSYINTLLTKKKVDTSYDLKRERVVIPLWL